MEKKIVGCRNCGPINVEMAVIDKTIIITCPSCGSEVGKVPTESILLMQGTTYKSSQYKKY